MKVDLSKDVLSIKDVKQNLANNIKLMQTKDSIGKALTVMTMLNAGNFEGFKSSGKIGYIENKELTRIAIIPKKKVGCIA